MKSLRLWVFTLLLVSPLFLPMRMAAAQLRATLEGHTDHVWSVAFSPDGKTLASASWDQIVRLWHVETEQLLHTLTGHTDTVMSVTFSLDGQTLASGSWDGTIRLWNPHTGKLKRTLTDDMGGVGSVVFSPDGKMLASGSADQTIRLWNTTTWQVERILTGHTHVVDVVAFSPDGNTLASGSRDKTIRLWNPHTKQLLHTLMGHTGDILRLMFSPDGTTLASGGLDGTIRLWNPHTGQLKRTLPNQEGWVNPVAFNPDGATLAIGNRGISLWDANTEEYKRPLIEDIGDVVSVVFSPDGQMIASGSADKKVRLWNFTPSDYKIPSINTNGMVRVVYFLPNDRPARPDRVTALRQLIKDTQQFYAEQMAHHGFGRKTFTVETDADGEPLIHQVNGKFTEDYYYDGLSDNKIWEELYEHFDDLQHIDFVAIDLSYEALSGGGACGLAGVGFFPMGGYSPLFAGKIAMRHRHETEGEEALGGSAIIPASGHCFEDNRGNLHRLRATTHELGHAFGLDHDFREDREDAVVGGRGFHLSRCAAEWLSVSRFFNTKSTFLNEPGEIQLLSLQPYGREVISLRFKVTDPDGLHQAQLLVPEIWEGTGWGPYRLFDCKRLNGKTSTVESVVRTAEFVDRITLQIIDVGGNITWATFPLQLDKAEPAQNTLDVNGDGVVNILDLTPIASHFGQSGKNLADVNGDGVVDIVDVLLIAILIPSLPPQAVETFTSSDVQKWLDDAKQLGVENKTLERGIVVLEYLLAEIALLSKPMEVIAGPLKAIFVGHTDTVWSVAFSPDGQMLASGSWDGTIRLWNPQTKQLKTTLIGHTDTVWSVAFSPDGQMLASGSWDGTIRLWNPQTGQLKRTLIERAGGVSSVAFSSDGQTLASGAEIGQIRLWNPHTGKLKRILAGHTGVVFSVAFSPDGNTLASGNQDGTVRLWDPNAEQHTKTLTGHTSDILRLMFSPDGTTLASGGLDGAIRLWNPHTGQLKRTLPNQGGWVNPVAFSPDGTTLAIGNRGISLWNVETGQYNKPLAADIGDVVSLVFSPDGQMIASGSADNTVRLWELTPAETSSDDTNGDINGDGVVNVLDLVVIASEFGNQGQNLAADASGDGVVNVLDLILVAGMFDEAAAAPSTQPHTHEILTTVEVQGWLTDALSLEIRDPIMKRGIMVLERLLAALTPTETELLINYPNPFNPETWIPYRLAEDAFVTLTIYDLSGRIVRTLDVGHRIASAYEIQPKAIYWDGKNELGESVASGVYFYTLMAGNYSATRKMVILK